jgi:hypothetical protein
MELHKIFTIRQSFLGNHVNMCGERGKKNLVPFLCSKNTLTASFEILDWPFVAVSNCWIVFPRIQLCSWLFVLFSVVVFHIMGELLNKYINISIPCPCNILLTLSSIIIIDAHVTKIILYFFNIKLYIWSIIFILSFNLVLYI